jgi:hypothetical protein
MLPLAGAHIPETISLPRLLGISGERRFSKDGSAIMSGVLKLLTGIEL